MICQLPRRLVHLALLLVSRRNSIIPPSRQPVRCYSVAKAVRGARLRSRANCCGNLQLSRFAVSCNYRAVLEMMVKVKCKLTGIEITLSSYGRCAPYCRFRVSKPNKKRNPIFNNVKNYVPINPLTAEWALRALIDFTLSNARRFYSSMGNPLDGKGLKSCCVVSFLSFPDGGVRHVTTFLWSLLILSLVA